MIGWYIGVVGIFVGIFGGVLFVKSLGGMKGKLLKSISYLVASSLIYVIFSSIMVVFGITERDIGDIWWEIVPILFAISAIFFVIGSKNLVKIILSASIENNMDE